MPFKNFSDFDYIPGLNLLPTDYMVGYREFNKEFKTQISDLAVEILRNIDLTVSPAVLYVSTAGKDTNSGTSEFNALRTIKRACARALEVSREGARKDVEERLGIWGIGSRPVNIFVKTGDYVEDNPIYLPPSCTLIGDNLRSTSIIPKNKFYDIIWVNNRCYVYGFTFRTHKSPSYAIAFPELRYDLTGALQPDWPNKRVQNAIQRATTFNGISNTLYPATTDGSATEDNLSLDGEGSRIFDPARIAFLRRYFLGINSLFFNEIEELQGIDFDETNYYKANVRRPHTLTSPYPQGCSSITQSTSAGADDAGGGVLVDGYKVDGPLRSMVMDSFTQFNEGGKGIHIINNGYAQLVSTFTICCTEGVMCETGGTCSINTSNCSFGLSGLVALGKSPKPTLVGRLAAPINGLTNQIQVFGLGALTEEQEFKEDFQPYPGQVFYIEDRTTIPTTSATNDGNYFNILSASKIFPFGDGSFACNILLDSNYTPLRDTSINTNILNAGLNSRVYFYIRSTVTASAHTLEYIGTGTTLLSAVPLKGGQTDVDKEVVFDNIGRVFFTSTNQFGDFRIGRDLTIVQSTGTIEGETFERSILTIVTPFTIAIASAL